MLLLFISGLPVVLKAVGTFYVEYFFIRRNSPNQRSSPFAMNRAPFQAVCTVPWCHSCIVRYLFVVKVGCGMIRWMCHFLMGKLSSKPSWSAHLSPSRAARTNERTFLADAFLYFFSSLGASGMLGWCRISFAAPSDRHISVTISRKRMRSWWMATI